jgi:hypothetical protein
MSVEAMKQMVEALEIAAEGGGVDFYAYAKEGRQAIAEAEKQEPVGWIDSKGNMVCTKINEFCKPLYTTPQQRTWVGLTADELNVISDSMKTWNSFQITDVYFAIEAKLKDKNNGAS